MTVRRVWSEGGAGVAVEGDLVGAFRAALASVSPAAIDTLEKSAADMLDEVSRGWPMDLRRRIPRYRESLGPPSRSLLRAELGGGQDLVTAGIVSPAPYTRYILSRQHGLGGRNPWVVLVRAPAAKRGQKIGSDVVNVVAAEFKSNAG